MPPRNSRVPPPMLVGSPPNQVEKVMPNIRSRPASSALEAVMSRLLACRKGGMAAFPDASVNHTQPRARSRCSRYPSAPSPPAEAPAGTVWVTVPAARVSAAVTGALSNP